MKKQNPQAWRQMGANAKQKIVIALCLNSQFLTTLILLFAAALLLLWRATA